jgi:D-alanyl-D-alanine carboxypeptidase
MQRWNRPCCLISAPLKLERSSRIGATLGRLRLVVFCSLIMIATFLVSSCKAPDTLDTQPGQPEITLLDAQTKRSTATPTTRSSPAASATEPPPPATATVLPTSTQQPTPTVTSTPAPTPSATPIGPCEDRMPGDSFYTLVNAEYGLSRHFVPPDLVPISDFLPNSVTLGYPTMIRRVVIASLVQMIGEMKAAGLNPTIISGYRSYSTQQAAWLKWSEQYPDRVSIISAQPGHSEHQLGTTIDFGSPELPEIVGEEDIQFHTSFYLTSEAIWLDQHAHEYGFHLSYPRNSLEESGMFYEPWHYRYLGSDLAGKLKSESMTFIQYALSSTPEPCIP